MAKYESFCVVKDGAIVDGPRSAPRSLGHDISGFDMLPLEGKRRLGWFPVVFDTDDYDPETEALERQAPVIDHDKRIVTIKEVVRPKTTAELAAEARSRRASAYPAVTDQLDAIWKEFARRRLAGENLAQAADDMLGRILVVKRDNPIPGEDA